jgi:hypothetical protein
LGRAIVLANLELFALTANQIAECKNYRQFPELAILIPNANIFNTFELNIQSGNGSMRNVRCSSKIFAASGVGQNTAD